MNHVKIAARPPLDIGHAVMAVIEDLQRQLQNPEEKKAVHRIRVDIKRLRAWLRLIRYNAGSFDWRAHDRHLSDLAGQLSAKRDAQVILDTLTWLEKKAKQSSEKQAVDEVRSRTRFDLGRHEVDWPYIKQSLSTEMDSLRIHVEKLDSTEIVREGLKRTYKRADKHGTWAFPDGGSIEDLHRLRKWVKYLYYQVEFVRKINSDRYRKSSKRLNELGNKLGRIHDLEILHKKVAQFTDMEECKNAALLVENLVERRMNKLIKRCNRLYRKVFNQSPSKFAQY